MSGCVVLAIKKTGCFLALSPVFCFPKRIGVGLLWIPADKSVVFEAVLLLGGFPLDLVTVQGCTETLGFQTSMCKLGFLREIKFLFSCGLLRKLLVLNLF